MKKILLIASLAVICISTTIAQNTNVYETPTSFDVNGTQPHGSAMLEIESFNKGILIPRMTQFNKLSINFPATGLLVYQTNGTPGFYYYDGASWQPIASTTTVTINAALDEIVDADADTKIQVEANADDDNIRFDVDGLERYAMHGPFIEVSNTGKSLYIGESAGIQTTIGTDDYNTVIGFDALYDNLTGTWNTAVGADALHHNRNGIYNSAFGKDALHETENGTHNTGIGKDAGFFSKSSFNTFLGASSNVTSTIIDNITAVGYLTNVSAANTIRIGNNAVTSIGGFTNWTNISDQRFKNNVTEDVPGLDFINQLRPVNYNLDRRAIYDFMGVENDEKLTFTNERETGFIAQEVEQIAQDLGFEFSGIDAPKNDKSHYGLRYAAFVVPLVKGMQEQQLLIDQQATEIETLKAELQSQKDASTMQFLVLQNMLKELQSQLEK